jgi:hypothetical protein
MSLEEEMNMKIDDMRSEYLTKLMPVIIDTFDTDGNQGIQRTVAWWSALTEASLNLVGAASDNVSNYDRNMKVFMKIFNAVVEIDRKSLSEKGIK